MYRQVVPQVRQQLQRSVGLELKTQPLLSGVTLNTEAVLEADIQLQALKVLRVERAFGVEEAEVVEVASLQQVQPSMPQQRVGHQAQSKLQARAGVELPEHQAHLQQRGQPEYPLQPVEAQQFMVGLEAEVVARQSLLTFQELPVERADFQEAVEEAVELACIQAHLSLQVELEALEATDVCGSSPGKI